MNYQIRIPDGATWLSDELKTKVAEHNKAVDEVTAKRADFSAIARELQDGDPLAIDPEEFAATHPKRLALALKLVQAESKAAQAAANLLDEIYPLAVDEENEQFDHVQDVIGKCKAKLAKIGITIEGMPAFGVDMEAAERQLTHKAMELPDYKHADDVRKAHITLRDSLGRQRRMCREAVDELRAQAGELVRSQLRSLVGMGV